MADYLQPPENPAGFPPMPAKLEETGLNTQFINFLLFKGMYMLGLETNMELASQLRLARGIVDDLLGKLKQQGFVEVRRINTSDSRIVHYALTNAAKDLAVEAARQCEYVGPAPVPLSQYQEQVKKQSLNQEKVSLDDLMVSLSHLVLPTSIIRKLGPAINLGQSLLVYGAPGNGKTSISEAIGRVYRYPIYIPHCIEVDGQIIRIFDQTVHFEIPEPEDDSQDYRNLLKKRPDPRWVKCRRPIVLTGGELTLEMLDLQYDKTAKFYEAPPQMKAIGGVFIIDDFGRQLVQPSDLINRWIVPLERGIDYLKIHTGKKFDIPFDEFVIFSTNISPNKLMDPGQLRRVKYKLRIDPPSGAEYVTIFKNACKRHDIYLGDEILSFLLEDYYPRTGMPLAGFHPIFIIDHVIAACQYRNEDPMLTEDLVRDAMENIYVLDPEDPNIKDTAKPSPLERSA